ncbi:MAG TPA: phospho-N-acetylmuramoyl-pentapeptide-transferase [Bacillota bacterium]
MKVEPVVYAALTSFALVMVAGPLAIPALRRLRMGQVVREQGPSRHLAKAGTPTMGGLLFVGACVVSAVWFAPRTATLWVGLGVIAAFAAIGFADDFAKVARRRSLGLRARTKLVGQAVAGFALYAVAAERGLGTWVEVPWFAYVFDLGPWYPLFVVVVLIASANAVNLTDGLDGLAAGSTVIALAFYLLVALERGQAELAVISGALAAGTAAFLFFNAHPAQIIMGDTGSMALGAALGVLAVLTKTELLLPVVGGLFVIEALSVIVQVGYFRLTGGRRLLKMSPLHHHFELSGWSEQRVVSAFWALSALFAALGLISLRSPGG